MRLLRCLFLVLLILVTHNIASAETCCWRHVKAEITVPANVSSKIVEDTWVSVFTSREYGGGPELTDCPLMVDVSVPTPFFKDFDYVFRGSLNVTQTERGTNQFALTVQLVDIYRGQVVKEGQTEWFCLNEITCAEALKDNVMALAKSFHPLDNILHNYERMPESALLEPEKDLIMAGKKMTIHVRDIVDSERRQSQSWQRILVKTEIGKILNGTPQAEVYRRFEVGDGSIDLIYKVPDECKKQIETITVYNTCNIDPRLVTFMPEREIASEKFDILCDRWEGTFTYTEQMAGIYQDEMLSRQANRTYSLTIKAVFNLKETSSARIKYESEDAIIDLSDSFQQTTKSITEVELRILESWNASKQGRIPMKVYLEFMFATDFHWYNVAFGEWESNPMTYRYKFKQSLAGVEKECKGAADQTHGALYELQDMFPERATYKAEQTFLTGDYSWDDIGSSVFPTWSDDCTLLLPPFGLPVSIPNMVYHKHLEWKIKKLSK